MKEYGHIIVHQTSNINNTLESLTYEWSGPPVTRIDTLYIRTNMIHGNNIHIGPYKMRIVDGNSNFFEYECVRLDYPFWRLIVFAHKASKLLRIIYARTIITLAVWGLADFDARCEPSWRDIKFIKKLTAKS